jgi:hypothetical protein
MLQAHINHRHVQSNNNSSSEYQKDEKQSPRLSKGAAPPITDPRAHLADSPRGSDRTQVAASQQAAMQPVAWTNPADGGAAAFGQQPPPQAAMYQRMVGAAPYQSAAASRTNLITVPIQDTSEPPPNYYPQSMPPYSGQQYQPLGQSAQSQYAAQQYYQYPPQAYPGAAAAPPPQRVSQYEPPPYQGQWQHPPAATNSFYR